MFHMIHNIFFQLTYIHGVVIEWDDSSDREKITSPLKTEIDRGIRIFVLGCFRNTMIRLLPEVFIHNHCAQCIIISQCSTSSYQGN